MEFSDKLRHGGPGQPAPLAVSPNGAVMASTQDLNVELRDVETLKVLQLYTALDIVDHIAWSPDSKYVACGMYKRGLVQVFSLVDGDWKCKIDAGPEGVAHFYWSPDSCRILTCANFQIRVTVWSLVDKSSLEIPFPKWTKAGTEFSPDGQYLAMAHREDHKDLVRIYSTQSFALMSEFFVETVDLVNLKWDPRSRMLAVWDTSLKYNVYVYAMDGKQLHAYSAYSDAMGIKKVSWAPCGQFLAVGSYDGQVRMLNHITWQILAEHEHTAGKIDGNEVDIYREHTMWDGDGERTRYAVEEGTVTVPVQKHDEMKHPPQLGVGLAEWSHDSSLLLTRNDNMPTAVWIWETQTLSLKALLLHDDPVKEAKWDPGSLRVALCTGNRKLFFWSADSAACVDVPIEGFTVNGMRWGGEKERRGGTAAAEDGDGKGEADGEVQTEDKEFTGSDVIILDDDAGNASKRKTFNHYCCVYLTA